MTAEPAAAARCRTSSFGTRRLQRELHDRSGRHGRAQACHPERMYRLRPPAQPLRPYIENYWFVSHEPDEDVDLRVEVFVDARADLIFNFETPYRREIIGGASSRHERSNLDAQRLVPIRILQRGAVRIVGVRFQLGGLAPFTRMPARRMERADTGARGGVRREDARTRVGAPQRSGSRVERSAAGRILPRPPAAGRWRRRRSSALCPSLCPPTAASPSLSSPRALTRRRARFSGCSLEPSGFPRRPWAGCCGSSTLCVS